MSKNDLELQVAKFEAGKTDFLNRMTILNRAEALDICQKTKNPRMTLLMDLDNTHEIIPLDLGQLSKMDDHNFIHDIVGIQKNFNRTTKQMDNFFLPRCAVPMMKMLDALESEEV